MTAATTPPVGDVLRAVGGYDAATDAAAILGGGGGQ